MIPPELLPVQAADALVRYSPSNGMFDVSYAAAWQLGRLLALQSQQFATNLYNWKRTHAQQLRQAEQQLIHPHLPTLRLGNHGDPAPEVPEEIVKWFGRLSRFHGVPFNYLVPDERMLPVESIRFFIVDPLWVECLLDGAFGIGRVTKADHQQDSQLLTQLRTQYLAARAPESSSRPIHSLQRCLAAASDDTISGFLLRSGVASGWPGLLVDGYDQVVDHDEFDPGTPQLDPLRTARLSANVLLCLFAGKVKTVDIHQKPEMLHFGLDRTEDPEHPFSKQLRNDEGKSGQTIQPGDLPWRDKSGRVIDLERLADIGKMADSAQFALRMIEGVEKVRLLTRTEEDDDERRS